MRILLAQGAELNATNRRGRTPLHWAALHGHQETVRVLIDAGADVNARTVSGDTALSVALFRGHRDVADLLPRHGALE